MSSRDSTKLILICAVVLCSALAVSASHKTSGNETSDNKEVTSGRKERVNLLSSLGTVLGAFNGGGQPSNALANGMKGVQIIQKFISRFQNVLGHPFSFRGVSDTMATITGLLAAVGGGYLTYVSMVGLFGSMLDPQNTAYQHAFSAPPHHYAPPPQHLLVGQAPPNTRRQSDGSHAHFGSYDIGKMFQSLTTIDYPEASFKLLRIKEESCKQRAVCELEKFLARKGVASVILKGVSKKIPGMERYLDAAYRGLADEDCSYAFSSCPYTLGQSLLRSIGLN